MENEYSKNFSEIATGMRVNLSASFTWFGAVYTLEAPAGRVFRVNGRNKLYTKFRFRKALTWRNYRTMTEILRQGFVPERRTQ